MHIIYRPSPDLYIVDGLSCNNHTGNQDQEIVGMNKTVNPISILVNMAVCTSTDDIQTAEQDEIQLQKLKAYIIHGWSHKKEEVGQRLRQAWSLGSEMTMTDGIAMKGIK